MEKLTLKNVQVIFANTEDVVVKGVKYGPSITINATAPEVKEAISKWVQENKIGKGDKAGVANFKEYAPEDSDTVTQFTFKFNNFTKFAARNAEFNKDMLGLGAEVSLTANAFHYTTGGGGISSSLQAVLVIKPKILGNEDAMKELEEGVDF